MSGLKDKTLHVRLTEDEVRDLERICDVTGSKKSEVIVELIKAARRKVNYDVKPREYTLRAFINIFFK